MSELPETHDASTESVPLPDDELVLENRHPSWLNWWKALLAAVCSGVFGLIGVGLGDIDASLPFVAGGLLIGGAVVCCRGVEVDTS